MQVCACCMLCVVYVSLFVLSPSRTAGLCSAMIQAEALWASVLISAPQLTPDLLGLFQFWPGIVDGQYVFNT